MVGRSPGLTGTGNLRPRHLPPMMRIWPADCCGACFAVVIDRSVVDRFAKGRFAIGCFAWKLASIAALNIKVSPHSTYVCSVGETLNLC
ncbi:hypothetical protein Y11_34241 [Yersinia enterocolitica subsp. palearctica Y11]|uniref:Uncharacterized protein n=1 Tax=Yersinia enterocolitica subsp. palearctica serotype O:3 (strain DSM 13030 / CIP 106945 / Y11) TaxID=930944 RepID=A0A0H3NUV4_YERE1|nr:hypothetical protein Y11_34241 [Yersinia enterocolitica subsp. palearctica Y11]